MEDIGHFGVKVDFEKDSSDPSRVFKTMTRIIDSVENMQDKLSTSLSLNVKRNLLLHEIKTGSLLTWLKGEVECSSDDEELKKHDNNEEKVTEYLDKGVKEFLRFSSENNKVSSISQVHELQDRLHDLALKTNIKNVPAYSKIPEKEILDILLKNNEPSKYLAPQDNVYFIFDDVNQKYNKNFSITKSSIEEVLTKKEKVENKVLEMMIKKPDYIGNSMWEFKLSNKIIDVTIAHDEWLEKFRDRRIILRPGDSLKACVEIKTKYSHNFEEIDKTYKIQEVVAIIEQPFPLQTIEMELKKID